MIERYVDIIEKTLERAWRDRANHSIYESIAPDQSGAIALEPFAWAFVAHVLQEKSPQLQPFDLRNDTKVIDTHGHARRVYRGLIYHVAKVVGIKCQVNDAGNDRFSREPISPSNAELLVDRVWFDLDDVRWSEFQLSSGALIVPDIESNPESTWYAELILLHALTTAACSGRDEVLLARARRAAGYVAREIQPDHASSQPWAIHAMLLDESTVTLADFMLHAAGIQQPSSLDSVSLLLLADALHSLSFLRRPIE